MKIYENVIKKDNVIIILEKKDVKVLYDAVELATKTNKRKPSFKKMLNQLYNELPF